MTNKDKFLKDGVSVEEFANEFHNFCAKQNNNNASSIRLEQFLSRKTTPTLTEDERVILKNVDKTYKYIHREYGSLRISLAPKGLECETFDMYDHLFQFIKERRRILY